MAKWSSISAILGGYLTSAPSTPRLWVAAAVAAILTAAGNVVNDYFDVGIDGINKPFRVLPSGQLSLTAAARWATTLVAIGLGLSMLLGAVMALIAAVMGVLLYVYSWKLKQSFLLGNAVISVMSAMTTIYGGLAVNSIGPTLVPALLIFVFMFCREILKTVEDYEGDRVGGARTIAVVWGKIGALRVFGALAVLVSFLSLLPWLVGDVSAAYLLLVVPGVDAVLLSVSVILLRRPTQRYIRTAWVATKAAWVLWIVAMFIGVMLTV